MIHGRGRADGRTGVLNDERDGSGKKKSVHHVVVLVDQGSV